MSTPDIPILIQQHDSLFLNQEELNNASPMSSEESKDGSRTPPSDTTLPDQPEEIVGSQPSSESYNMEKLLEIFSENILAKTLRIATEALKNNVHIQQKRNLYRVSNFAH